MGMYLMVAYSFILAVGLQQLCPVNGQTKRNYNCFVNSVHVSQYKKQT